MLLQQLLKQSKVSQEMLNNAARYADPSIVQIAFKDQKMVTSQAAQGPRLTRQEIVIGRDGDGNIDSALVKCSCGAFYRNRSDGHGMFCVHTLALASMYDGGFAVIDPSLLITVSSQRQPRQRIVGESSSSVSNGNGLHNVKKSVEVFQNRVTKAVDKAITALSLQVKDHFMREGERGLLLTGGTGTGKSSAVEKFCREFGWNFVLFKGSETTTNSSAFGISAPGLEGKPRKFHIAFELARKGEKTVLFIDELLRLNPRFLDDIMTTVQTKKAGSVRKMLASSCPIPDDFDDNEDVYVGEADYWPMQWCPAKNLLWVYATNPWGHKLDPAFAKRVVPLEVEYNECTLEPFNSDFKEKVKRTWQMCKDGEISLPIEYAGLRAAQSANDKCVFDLYLSQLRLVDLMEYELMQGQLALL